VISIFKASGEERHHPKRRIFRYHAAGEQAMVEAFERK
jgi:hypothetical protein